MEKVGFQFEREIVFKELPHVLYRLKLGASYRMGTDRTAAIKNTAANANPKNNPRPPAFNPRSAERNPNPPKSWKGNRSRKLNEGFMSPSYPISVGKRERWCYVRPAFPANLALRR